MNRRTMLVALAGAASLMLTACGSTEPATNASGSNAPAQAITVTDSRGKTITLDRPATRVVTLEWNNTEEVIDLGVQPVGISDIKGFTTWDTAVKISGDPVDVGMRAEPSLESVAKAAPDLILGVEASIPASALEQMEKIAPVVLLKSADRTRPIEQMRDNYTTTARLLGKDKEATDKLAAFDKAIADARTAFAKKAQAPYALTYLNVTGNNVDFRMHSDASLAGAVAKEMGLVNAWEDKSDSAWGVGSLDVEGMTKLPADTRLLYFLDTTGADPVTTVLADNAVWKALPMVANGQVKRMPDGIWIYGGPASLTQWVNAITSALA
ncbi:MAG: ABC transporter substrate-binding protein [Propionibacteriaceae bacterium]